MSIVPLCAYFGVFRSTPATADKPQGLIVNVPVDKDPSELLQQEQQVIPQFDDEEQLTGGTYTIQTILLFHRFQLYTN